MELEVTLLKIQSSVKLDLDASVWPRTLSLFFFIYCVFSACSDATVVPDDVLQTRSSFEKQNLSSLYIDRGKCRDGGYDWVTWPILWSVILSC